MHFFYFSLSCFKSGLYISKLTITNSTFVDLRNIKQLSNINLYVATELMEMSILSNELNKAV